MEDAVLNGYIGYDQNHSRRKGLYDSVATDKINFNVKKMLETKGTDCSGLVYTALRS
jgi:hypothetical protein